jgi:hypothetical protein
MKMGDRVDWAARTAERPAYGNRGPAIEALRANVVTASLPRVRACTSSIGSRSLSSAMVGPPTGNRDGGDAQNAASAARDAIAPRQGSLPVLEQRWSGRNFQVHGTLVDAAPQAAQTKKPVAMVRQRDGCGMLRVYSRREDYRAQSTSAARTRTAHHCEPL